MARLKTQDGATVDSLAVAIDDAVMTIYARLDLIDDESRAWIRSRMRQHANDVQSVAGRRYFNAVRALSGKR